MLQRREFLKRSSLLSLAPTIPTFLANTAGAIEARRDDRVLVVIQLNGGNDGINTVVPFADEGYTKYRDKLRLPADQLVKLNAEVGLHPSMTDLGKLFDSDRLAVVQGVGYPNPNRSHAASMAIWQTCNFDEQEQNTHGWLGLALDQSSRPADGAPAAILIGDEQPPVALRGRRSVASAMNRLSDFTLSESMMQSKPKPNASENGLAAFAQRTSLDAYTTAERLSELAAKPEAGVTYPNGVLADRLQLISRLLKSGFGTRVFYAVQSGYDTHAAQLATHSRLLRNLSGSIYAFLEDLRASNLDDRVAVVCFSEFGRRVKENASLGTDHGTAGPVFVAGKKVQAGLHSKTPSLLDLDNGDVKMSIDFRGIYASVLEHWLRIDSTAALGAKWDSVDLFAGT